MYSISVARAGRQPPSSAASGVELQMREVGAAAGHRLHALDGGADVARHAEVVAVDVRGVRQLQILAAPTSVSRMRRGVTR